MNKKLTLHDAILQVICIDHRKPMSTKEIADEINKKDYYQRKDGKPVEPSQISARVNKKKDILKRTNDSKVWVSDSYAKSALRELQKDERKTKINSMSLGNFKGFSTEQEIPIKPITLVFGENSAGKSSIMQSLLFMAQSNKINSFNISHTENSGDLVDLGGYKNIIYNHQYLKNNLKFSLSSSISIDYLDIKELKYSFEISQKEIEYRVSKEGGELLSEIATKYGVSEEEIREHNNLRGDNVSKFKELKIILGEPYLIQSDIETDGEPLFSLARRPDGIYRIQSVNEKNKYFLSIIESILKAYSIHKIPEGNRRVSEVSFEDGLIHSALSGLRVKCIGVKPIKVNKVSAYDAIVKDTDIYSPPGAIFRWLPQTIENSIFSIIEDLFNQISNLSYLSAKRSYPSRHFSLSELMQDLNYSADGGNAWDILLKNEDIRNKVNSWLCDKDKFSTPYQWKLNYLYDESYMRNNFRDILKDYLDPDQNKDLYNCSDDENSEFMQIYRTYKDDLGNYDIDETGHSWKDFIEQVVDLLDGRVNKSDLKELLLIDQNLNLPVSHRDVGMGISQVMPVLVNCYANNNKLILIEEPEIHVHPHLQAELGNIFIESAKDNNNTLIIETHSENLILRFLKKIREKEITPDDLSIIHISKHNGSSHAVTIDVDVEGKFLDPWPDDFFSYDLKEIR